MPTGAAESGGVEEGDMLEAVDGVDVRTWPLKKLANEMVIPLPNTLFRALSLPPSVPLLFRSLSNPLPFSALPCSAAAQTAPFVTLCCFGRSWESRALKWFSLSSRRPRALPRMLNLRDDGDTMQGTGCVEIFNADWCAGGRGVTGEGGRKMEDGGQGGWSDTILHH